jgi:DNA-binding NtrC family response regulator
MNKKKQINIFIVEDNKVFALALKADIEATFSNMPITIHLFVTGETCMDKFQEEKPKVVILDYHLNSKYTDAADGLVVLDWIKKENDETNVIMITNDDQCDIALKSFKHGASDYVVKSETKFSKINHSLFTTFKMMEAKSDAKKYKNMAIGLGLFVAFLVGVILTIYIVDPILLK